MVRVINRGWGGRPRPRRTPGPAHANTREQEADEGVGSGPGDRPYMADFLNKLLGRETSLD